MALVSWTIGRFADGAVGLAGHSASHEVRDGATECYRTLRQSGGLDDPALNHGGGFVEVVGPLQDRRGATDHYIDHVVNVGGGQRVALVLQYDSRE
jgi:hypothetical protein